MFEINKIYKTKNGSKVVYLRDKEFSVIKGGHQIRKYRGSEAGDSYYINMDGKYLVPTSGRYFSSELDGMSVLLDEMS